MKRIISLVLPLVLAAAAVAEPELVLQKGNTIESARRLKYSADGKYIMRATLFQADIYERQSGILVKQFSGSFFKDFSPDAKYILFSKKEGDAWKTKLTEVANRKETAVIVQNAKDDYVRGLAFSPNSSFIAIDDSDCVTIYDIKTKKQKSILKELGYFFYAQCAWSADSRYLAVPAAKKEGGAPKAIIIYDLKENKIAKTIESNFVIDNIAISPSGSLAAFTVGQKIIHIRSALNGDVQKKFEIEMPAFEEGNSVGVQFSSDEKKVVAATSRAIAEYDLESGSLKIKKQERDCYAFALPTFSSSECAIADNQGITFYDASANEIKKIQDVSNQFYANESLKDGRIFVSDPEGKAAAIFDQNLTRLELSDNAAGITALNNLSVFKNAICYSDSKTKTIYFRDLKTKKDSPVVKNVNATTVLASPDGSYIAYYDEAKKRTLIYNAATKKATVAPGFEAGFYNSSSVFSPSSRYVFLDGKNGKQIAFDVKENFEVLRTALSATDISFLPAFTPDEKYFFAPCEKGVSRVYDTSSYKWRLVKTFEKAYYPFCSPDGTLVGMYGYEEKDSQYWYSLYTVGSWRPTAKFSRGTSHSIYNFFSADNSKIYAFASNGVLQCFSVKDQKLLASALSDKNGDWLKYTPEGYFDGSENGLKSFVYLVDGMKAYPLDSLTEKLYRPDLVAAKFEGASVPGVELPQNGDTQAASQSDLAQIVSSGQPPLVDFIDAPKSSSSRDVTINFTVKDQGGGIGGVYLKLNGKTVTISGGERKLELVGDAPQGKSSAAITFSHPVSLQNGENKIEIFASNSTGMIEGEHKTASITWQGKTQKPSLYVLAVGVNKYRDKSLWLNYAVPDASAVSDTFKNIKGKLYQSINISTVFDGDVTEAGVASAFDAVASKISADDVFVFYISGHGTTHTDGDYYFIPVDFRFRNAQSVAESALSKKFIADQLSKIKAQKSLVLLDTCNSGAFISTGARGMAEKTAIDRLSRATGQATIAASSDSQSAMEGYKGHGIFTYVILEALSGKADLNKDGYVTVSELAMYAEDKVPTYSYDKWGYEQYPQVDLRKQSNFPLVGK